MRLKRDKVVREREREKFISNPIHLFVSGKTHRNNKKEKNNSEIIIIFDAFIDL